MLRCSFQAINPSSKKELQYKSVDEKMKYKLLLFPLEFCNEKDTFQRRYHQGAWAVCCSRAHRWIHRACLSLTNNHSSKIILITSSPSRFPVSEKQWNHCLFQGYSSVPSVRIQKQNKTFLPWGGFSQAFLCSSYTLAPDHDETFPLLTSGGMYTKVLFNWQMCCI